MDVPMEDQDDGAILAESSVERPRAHLDVDVTGTGMFGQLEARYLLADGGTT